MKVSLKASTATLGPINHGKRPTAGKARARRIAMAALTAAVSTGPAHAATNIGFQPLERASSVPLTYTESGYTIQSNDTRTSPSGTVSNATLSVQHYVGNVETGIPSVTFQRSTSFSLTGGTFTFDGLSAFFGGGGGVNSNSFTVAGFLLDEELYSKQFTSTGGTSQPVGAFRKFESESSVIFDKLVFTSGNALGQILLDDLKVSAATVPVIVPTPVPNPDPVLPPVTAAVPEPATWAMMLLGFGFLGSAMRRRRTTLRYA